MKLHRTGLQLGSVSVGAMAIMLCATPVVAATQDACGLVDGEVTCTVDGGPYDDGIRYDEAGNLVVHLEPGLSLDTVAGKTALMAISTIGSGGSLWIDGSGASINSKDGFGVFAEAQGDLVIDLASVTTQVEAPGMYTGASWRLQLGVTK
ncbi:hypothetical protein [Novosphingobium kaempferiae]|uniref:hypothetical protein n=1 Tax=Novosphingobium kaempferiae TaxID=2896849 RepID=UPI001E2E8DA0|nr:hypothetical protein [Novosphingobium kaempferiae]